MASSDTDSMPSYPPTPPSPHVTQQPMTAFAPTISFSPTWQTLGPFQIGTREATWGADPLEALGGFHCLPYNESATFPSSLATNGTVSWSTVEASISSPAPTSARAELLLSFENADWGFLQSVYGWAALQYQGWTRGSLTVHGDNGRRIVLYTDNILEFWVDDEHYFGGDFYSFRRAPLVLLLKPGEHSVEVRVVRDVRAMGGVGKPTVSLLLEAELSEGRPQILNESLLLPDMVEGRLSSSLGSVTVRNEGDAWIDVVGAEAMNATFVVRMRSASPLRLAPGQSRPLALEIATSEKFSSDVLVEVLYTAEHSPAVFRIEGVRHVFSRRTLTQPQKITYLHPGGVVSYAILRPPSNKALHKSGPDTKLPVVLGLHGAGVETDSDLVRHSFAGAPDLRAWVLFPSGVTPWSGDDWHRWGFADVEAAIAAVPEWIRAMQWHGCGIDTDRWLVTGHSNGGQGVWYILTHRPDKLIGAAPVSAYSSIQAYVPYQLWYESDPTITAIVQGSLSDYRHELLLENSRGIPVHQQHGSLDDNVPPRHSRRMSQLLSQIGCASEYTELPAKNHWFEGVMTTQNLLRFYDKILENRLARKPIPSTFEFVVVNPGTMGSKYGIVVDQLTSPERPGMLSGNFNPEESSLHLHTSNVHRLHFLPTIPIEWLGSNIIVDGSRIQLLRDVPNLSQWLLRLTNGSWMVSNDIDWSKDQRHGRQVGGIDALLNTGGTFIIRTPVESLSLATQVSRNLFQYFGADTEIVALADPPKYHEGIEIQLFLGNAYWSSPTAHAPPIYVDRHIGLVIQDANGHCTSYGFSEGLGAIFLWPSPVNNLNLMVWGSDLPGLRSAVRLVPMLAGVGQPDFVIVSRECAWKGIGGVRALGHFNSFWNISNWSVIQ